MNSALQKNIYAFMINLKYVMNETAETFSFYISKSGFIVKSEVPLDPFSLFVFFISIVKHTFIVL